MSSEPLPLMAADVALTGWRALQDAERWDWFQQLYEQAAHLNDRYRLGLRSGWWEDDVQVELIAALGAWVAMFDNAAWTDPQGKAHLLIELSNYREQFKGGRGMFDPARDRNAFQVHLTTNRSCPRPSVAS